MPRYDFHNTKTDEHFEKDMTIAEMEEYMVANPHIVKEWLVAAAQCDSIRMGRTKPDQGFQDVLQKVHERTPGSVMNDTCRYL